MLVYQEYYILFQYKSSRYEYFNKYILYCIGGQNSAHTTPPTPMTPRHRGCQSPMLGKRRTHLPAKASLGEIPHDLVLTFSCLKDLKTPPKCLPSGNACSQKRAPRQSGISRTPFIFVTSIFLITLRIRAMGRAQYAFLPFHGKEKASTPAQEAEKEYA
jgi:hypothetical protein